MKKSEAYDLLVQKGPEAFYDTVFPQWKGALNILPHHMWRGTVMWIAFGIMPGEFLQAIIRGDLFAAAYRADDDNAARLFEWAKFFYSSAPIESKGPNALQKWKGVTFDTENVSVLGASRKGEDA